MDVNYEYLYGETPDVNLTSAYLEDAGFKPLKAIDLSRHPQIVKRCSFLLGTISYLIDPVHIGFYEAYLFGGAVRDAVSGLVSEGSDFDFVISGSDFNGPDSILMRLQSAPRFRGMRRFLPQDLQHHIATSGNEELLDIDQLEEGKLYELGWGGIKGPVEMYFDASLLPSATKGKAPSQEIFGKCRKFQFLAARYCNRPDWSKVDDAAWDQMSRLIDPIEHTIRPVRMVDIACCGLILTSLGILLEAVPGAFEDALNRRLRLNQAPGVCFHNTASRLERLANRGYIIS